MSEIDRVIHQRVDAFVAEIAELVRQSALETVADALQTVPPKHGHHSKHAKNGIRSARVASAPPRRRTPEELGKTQGKLLAAIKETPGQRIEQIAKAINVPTKELALPITKMIESREIRRDGQKRATRYFPRRRKGGN